MKLDPFTGLNKRIVYNEIHRHLASGFEGEEIDGQALMDVRAIRSTPSNLDGRDIDDLLKPLYLKEHLEKFISKCRVENVECILNIVSDTEIILDLPWQSMHINGAELLLQLKTQAYIFRHLSNTNLDFQISPQEKIKIMVCTPPPEDYVEIKSQIEEEIIFLKSLPRTEVYIHYCKYLDDVVKAVKEVGEIDIFHYTGHGDVNSLFIKKDSSTTSKNITANDLYKIIDQTILKPKLIILNCCLSSFTSSDTQKSLGAELLKLSSVQNILSFRYFVSTLVSQKFVERFYKNFLMTGNVYSSYLAVVQNNSDLLDTLHLYGK